ncbi:MAG: TauD/TfdA family dioxygenase [Sphingomonadales bacterium]|nr:TauD/TfdA family dioxygenase [Sphingomonadales bacterium]
MATQAATLEVRPLGDGVPFGAAVIGLTRGELDDERVRQSLRALWIDKGVLLFRGGESSPEMQLALSRCFGPLEPHPFPESRLEGEPDLVKIKYYPEDGTRYEVEGELRGGWLAWHSDLIYTHRINHGGILRPLQLPRRLGQTGFLCQIAGYERLPQSLRARIEGLHVVYEVVINMARHPFSKCGGVELRRLATSGGAIEQRRFTYPRVIHPMVFTQAETGRKVLNVSPAFAAGIYELGGPDGDALLAEVIAIGTDPSLAYFHEWQQDDMVLWDNWRTLHCAAGVEPDDTRVMVRTTIAGDYALGRQLGPGGPVADFDV